MMFQRLAYTYSSLSWINVDSDEESFAFLEARPLEAGAQHMMKRKCNCDERIVAAAR